MAGQARGDWDHEDWRLQAELDIAEQRPALERLVAHLRPPTFVRELQSSVPHDVVITHDGKLLFAYAADETPLKQARAAIESTLRHDGIGSLIRVSHWDHELDAWRQIDPPLTATEAHARETSDRDAETVETRTLVASAGKMIRAEFEQSLREWADKLGVRCTLVENPHLLTTQVGFTVTGSRRKLDEFAQGLAAEERAIIRTERTVMMSPL